MAIFHLVIEPPAGGRYEHRLALGSYVLGREQGTCDVAIISPEISRRHVRLTLTEAQCTVEDLGSTSGTYHSGQAVQESRALPYPLELHLGTVRLSITLVTQQSGDTNGSGVAGHYMKGAEIAKGGMGAVLEANDQLLGRTVAMKVVRHDIGDSESIRLRFIREATVLARLEHPSIVPIYEMGKDAEGRLYYTMKMVEGRTLQAILDDLQAGHAATLKEYTLDRLLSIFRKICEAMAFAHAKGVIHRDLKPENVMVGQFGEVLVMDWGLAKVLYDVAQTAQEIQFQVGAANGTAVNAKDSTLPTGFEELSDSQMRGSSQNLTVDGAVMGSPQYMPPEQAEGKVGDLDERADVFSLGGILYAILTLKPPVEGRTVMEVLDKVKSGKIVPPTHFNIGSTASAGKKLPAGSVSDPKLIVPLPHCPGGRVPSTLSAVTMKALAFDREQRYGSVGELLADVEAYQRGFATSAENVNVLGQLGLMVKRHKGIAVSAGVAVVLIAFLTGAFVWRIGEEKTEAVAQADRATDEAAKAKMAEQSARRAEGKAIGEFSKAQIALAEAAYRSLDVENMVKALEACPPERRDQTWEYLAAKRDGSSRAVQLPGWKTNEVPEVVAVPGRAGVFAFAGRQPVVELHDVAANRKVLVIDTGETGSKKLAFSGDQKVMAVALGQKGEVVQLFDLREGKRLKSIRLPEKELAPKATRVADRGVSAIQLSHDGHKLLVERPQAEYPWYELRMMDTQNGTTLWTLQAATPKTSLHPDGSLVAVVTSGRERYFKLLAADSGEEINTFPMYGFSVSFSPNGKLLAIGSMDGSLYVLDAKTGKQQQAGKLYASMLEQIAWTADNRLLTMGNDGKFWVQGEHSAWRLALWQPENLQHLGSFHGLPAGRVGWSLNPSSGQLVTAQSPPRLWAIPIGLEVMRNVHRSEQGWNCAFLDDNQLLGRLDFELARYDLSKPASKAERLVPAGFATGAVERQKKLFAAGSRYSSSPHFLKLFSYREGKIEEKWSQPIARHALQLDFDATGERLLGVFEERGAEIFSVQSGESILKLSGNVQNALFAGQDGKFVTLRPNNRTATGASDELVQYDGASGKPLGTNTMSYRVSALAVSPDRALLAVVGADQQVHVLEADSLKEKNTFRAHDDEITAVTFHPTRPVVATASMDGSVKVWDYQNLRLVNYFIGLQGTPVCLAFSPNGKWLAVEGQEHASRVFDVSQDMPMAQAK